MNTFLCLFDAYKIQKWILIPNLKALFINSYLQLYIIPKYKGIIDPLVICLEFPI